MKVSGPVFVYIVKGLQFRGHGYPCKSFPSQKMLPVPKSPYKSDTYRFKLFAIICFQIKLIKVNLMNSKLKRKKMSEVNFQMKSMFVKMKS